MDLEKLLEQEEENTGNEEMDSLSELKDYVEQNSSITFKGSNNETKSTAIITSQVPANSIINVGDFGKMAEIISQKTGTQINRRQAAAAWYYMLYQIFHNKE